MAGWRVGWPCCQPAWTMLCESSIPWRGQQWKETDWLGVYTRACAWPDGVERGKRRAVGGGNRTLELAIRGLTRGGGRQLENSFSRAPTEIQPAPSPPSRGRRGQDRRKGEQLKACMGSSNFHPTRADASAYPGNPSSCTGQHLSLERRLTAYSSATEHGTQRKGDGQGAGGLRNCGDTKDIEEGKKRG